MARCEAPDSQPESSQRLLSPHGTDKLPLLSYPGWTKKGRQRMKVNKKSLKCLGSGDLVGKVSTFRLEVTGTECGPQQFPKFVMKSQEISEMEA